jgi:ATP-binding cassette subfamily B protein
MDCGPTCLRMVARYYGKSYSLAYLTEQSYVTKEGASLLGLREAAAALGLEAKCVQVSLAYLETEPVLPCIAHWDQNHFVVVYKIKGNRIYVADPALKYDKEAFSAHWAEAGLKEGYALLVRPTPNFASKQEVSAPRVKLWSLLVYLKPYRQLMTQLLLGMLLGSLIQLALPFLTQLIVDRGINHRDFSLLQLVLLGQFLLILSRTTVDFIRGWLLFYISTPINVSLVYDFLVKLVKLPLRFFDTKMVGDILQRVGDHQRVEYFLTTAVLSVGLTGVNLIVFSVVLLIYNVKIFWLFCGGTVLYLIWMRLFLKNGF